MTVHPRARLIAGGLALAALSAGGCKSDDAGDFGGQPQAGPFSSARVGQGDPTGVGQGNPTGVGVEELGPPPDIPTQLYEIQKGDTLTKIANDHGTTVSMLRRLNGIQGSFIRYGQKLKVPAGADAGGDPAGGAPEVPAPATPEPGGGEPAIPAPAPPVAPDEGGDIPAPIPGVGDEIRGADGGIGGADSGFGFGGDSAPRTGAPTRRDDGF